MNKNTKIFFTTSEQQKYIYSQKKNLLKKMNISQDNCNYKELYDLIYIMLNEIKDEYEEGIKIDDDIMRIINFCLNKFEEN